MTNRVTISKSHIIVHLLNPFWGVWKTYGWEKSVEGFGISAYILNQAKNFDRRIIVQYKYGCYEVNWPKLFDFIKEKDTLFKTREGTILYIFPRTLFKRMTSKEYAEIKRTGK